MEEHECYGSTAILAGHGAVHGVTAITGKRKPAVFHFGLRNLHLFQRSKRAARTIYFDVQKSLFMHRDTFFQAKDCNKREVNL